jgi:ABC-type multidrug transport system fused ATPase/permease subunit
MKNRWGDDLSVNNAYEDEPRDRLEEYWDRKVNEIRELKEFGENLLDLKEQVKTKSYWTNYWADDGSDWKQVFAGLCLLALSLALLLVMPQVLQKTLPVMATVTGIGSGSGSNARIYFEYQVNEKTYNGHWARTAERSNMQVGQSFEIFYSQKDPSQYYNGKFRTGKALLILLFYLLLFVASLIVLTRKILSFFAFRKHQREYFGVTDRSSTRKQSSFWDCTYCGMANEGSAALCEKCGKRK